MRERNLVFEKAPDAVMLKKSTSVGCFAAPPDGVGIPRKMFKCETPLFFLLRFAGYWDKTLELAVGRLAWCRSDATRMARTPDQLAGSIEGVRV